MFEGHTDDCLVRRHPEPDFYGVFNPDGWGHCEYCHCSCDPDGPFCGHTAGCPGC